MKAETKKVKVCLPSKLVEKGWGKGAEAWDKHNKVVDDPKDPRACRWCAIGAIRACGFSQNGQFVRAVARLLARFNRLQAWHTRPASQIWSFNDNPITTKREVLKVLRTAEKELGYV